MRLRLFDPKWDRSCSACSLYQYEQTGAIKRDRRGNPMPRGKAPTPCDSCPKVPDWAKGECDWRTLRDMAVEMSDQNERAYAAYQRFKAVGSFPADAIVGWYSPIIRTIEDEWFRQPGENAATLLLSLAKVIAAKVH